MGLVAADAGDPSGGEHMVPALHPHLADRAEAPPHPLSPWRKKAASMAAVVPVEGADDGGEHGFEHLTPAFPPLLQQPTATTTVALNPLSPCTKSQEFDIDWGQYLDNDARMLTLGESGSVVPAGPLLPLLAQAIGSSIQLNDVDAALQTNDVDVDCQPDDESECDPFDNEEEYVGVDDENMYDISVPITITVTEEAVVMQEAEVADVNRYGEAEVMQHVQEEAEVADIDPLQFNIAHDLEILRLILVGPIMCTYIRWRYKCILVSM